ncbi:TetR/AcrR family transcriptional regulator [Amycolatopsis balhimycina DSM 5908]|uniref:TetR/AcrR family transcriptional regulator n=1 Tax=Amycolatopsis balhimycina DSM 5908 TaxID=1081091 RepID=A0A428X1C0_AMYBA|nr:TetR/AcrR family transcriptional regulator [Amycolatopsis balhimycina]RSM49109.1 TetR/AcrR family transcriptional regulator [Amycolatopsis balhimycina DSM 5908]
MDADWTTEAPAKDRRVRRSRAALMRAAVGLVGDRGTAAVPVSDIAETADVSRQVLYQQFGDRDALLLEAALDLVRRELLKGPLDGLSGAGPGDERASMLALARHFAAHRRFYRALLTSSSAFALNQALTGVFLPHNRESIVRLLGDRLGRQGVEDLATFLTGGAGALVNTWVIEGPEPLDPEEFTDRLMEIRSVVTDMITKESRR